MKSQRFLLQVLQKRQFFTQIPRLRAAASDNKMYSKEKTTHFGFKNDVSEMDKKDKVLGVFNSVADSYDLMNDAMSFGIHRLWKNRFVDDFIDPPHDIKVLDVAGGTGDIAFRILDKLGPNGHVTMCDINANMLEAGKKRSENKNHNPNQISWIVGDAQALEFPDDTFDAYTIAFGIRNVVNIDKTLKEAYRVLKPGGRFFCLEFSHVENPVIEQMYDFYSFNVIPPMGKVLANDMASYQYLVESIRRFPKQIDFCEMISNAGFRGVNYVNLSFGVSAMHTGYKLPLK